MTTSPIDEKAVPSINEEEAAYHCSIGNPCFVDLNGEIRDIRFGEKSEDFAGVFVDPSSAFEEFRATSSLVPETPVLIDEGVRPHLLKSAPQLYSRRWSEHPAVISTVDDLVSEIFHLRRGHGKRIRGIAKYKKHLKVILIDLWVAANLTSNPYRSISKRKEEYQKPTRYKRIFLKYDYVAGVLSDLVGLGYFEEVAGFRYRTGAEKGYRTRIKATQCLLDKINSYGVPATGLIKVVSRLDADPLMGKDILEETIILRDERKKNIPYSDTPAISHMRDNLEKINKKLTDSFVTLKCTDEEFKELFKRASGKSGRGRATIDFTSNSLHRVFNENFEWGGRFYGGWWQEIPKEFRKFIEVGRKYTVELDYSGHHFRILYAKEGVSAPADPYEISGFDRSDLKTVSVIMLNATSRRGAIAAAKKKAVKKPGALVKAIERGHASIAHYFYTGVGRELQRMDSDIAEEVMLKMLERGAVVLPIHDSFIVRASYAEELEEMMRLAFEAKYSEASIKPKKTVLDDKEPRTKCYSLHYRYFGY